MLLSGCITIESDDKNAEPKKEETQKVEKENKSSEKESKSTDSKKEDSLSVAKDEDTKSNSSSSSSSNSSSKSSSDNPLLRGDNGEDLRRNSKYAPEFSTSKSNSAGVTKYMADIVSYSTEVTLTLDLVDKISNSDSKSFSQKKNEVGLSLGSAKAQLGKLKNLKAPSGFEGDQKNIVKAMDLYGEGFQLMIDAIDTMDETKVDQAITKVQDGERYWMEAINSIDSKTR
ncbi:hypothetical protein J4P90_08360 [Bacillus sp. SY8(2021)]|uniref:DUF7018 domain-containing protein n=1 Tax=Bacillus arachidis TaxID=2819290 RepID=A0ABS3NWE2_9BACI|nr:hypothetical protein [Bacillus arachidis]MBO1625258.1 hypothetical protein [Bacillus arachidis]